MTQVSNADEITANAPKTDRKLEKRLRHECLRCTDQALPDSDFCGPHRDKERKAKRESAQKRRKGFRFAGKCVDCGRRSKKWRCPKCHRKSRTEKGVERKARGVEKREIWRNDPGTNWNRYRGKGRRGRLTREEQQAEDERDAKFAIAELEKFIVESRRLVRPEVLELPRIQREEERRKATLYLGNAGRFIDELAEKYE